MPEALASHTDASMDDALEPHPLSHPSALLAFRRLDRLLGRAVEMARTKYGPDAPADAFRGLYVSPEQADRALQSPAGEPLLTEPEPVRPGWDRIAGEAPGWGWLQQTYRLSDFELDVVLLALAPEVDLRYERLYGYLQDDVGRRRPTVGLALELVYGRIERRLAARDAFGPDSPLIGRRVLTLVPDARAVAPSLLAHFLLPDPQILGVLLQQRALDPRLSSCCRLVPPMSPSPECAVDNALLRLVRRARGRYPLRLYFQGPAGAGRRRTAQSLAAELSAPLLVVDADRLPTEDIEALRDVLFLVVREASLRGALLYVDEFDALRPDEHTRCLRVLADRLAEHDGVTIVAGTRPWAPVAHQPLGMLTVPFVTSDPAGRRRMWEGTLASHHARVAPDDIDALAARFRLEPGQIEDAALTALAAARRRAAGRGPGTPGEDGCTDDTMPTYEELSAAARGQTGHQLTALAHRRESACDWSHLVLPPDSLAQLHELCDWVAHRRQVLGDWGFGRVLPGGNGISALFAGPPGTGKTLAAEVIAGVLGLDLFRIDLSMVISKYIGETEKNLEKVFTAADDGDAVLLFDEADALFGKRSEVRDSHDRYANIEVAYLLQRMERYDGLAILATNRRHHLDDAFTRRLQFVVEFPFPGETERHQIWERCFPTDAPRAPALDLERLARDFRLSGGNIRNIVLRAAYLAAADGPETPIGMAHLLPAVQRECQKTGRVMPEADRSQGLG
ncbi:AAA family ATPase [Streptomyces sp. NPDC005355]|uniref:AAA family ATPase n=1 Tax=Streptomyces sp. NPDC005355 TaxID=3157038 RepID=UPI0033AC8733